MGSLRLWKVIRHEKCQFSPTSLRVLLKIEASKLGCFGATIEPKAGKILTGLKFVLESGGKIDVRIKGMDIDKEELKFLRVKAIAAGKEYYRDDKMYIQVMRDPIKVIRTDPADGVFCVISRVPAGPAEVHVAFNKESLPSKTVEVKNGESVRVDFELNIKKVILSGIVTYLGKPLPNWLVLFKRTDGKPITGLSGVVTPADGWYEIKLYPETYEIQLCEPEEVADKGGVKVKGHVLKFKKIHAVTKTETLNLEISGLKRVD